MVKVLVADDDANIRNLIKLVLNEHEIIEASDGSEAYDKFVANNPDIVFLDIVMPNMNGAEACKKIRAINKKVKIYMLSGKTLDELKDMPEMDADDLITKPFELNTIKALVEAYEPDPF